MTDKNSLPFGYNAGLPAGVRAAWGARLIVRQDGYTDFLHDRQGGFGSADSPTLHPWLDGGVLKEARERASELLACYRMNTRQAEEFVLVDDRFGKVVGNTNGSAGYLYLAAWLHDDVPAEVTS